ncbi:rubredoxin-like domain-containing protein [Trichloromonas sp.]
MMKKWRCVICDYIHEGPEPPETCPDCGAGKDSFEEVEE